MRAAFTQLGVGVLGLSGGAWLAWLGANPDDPFGAPWLGWLLLVASVGLVLWASQVIRVGPRGGDDFTLTWLGPQMWVLERVRKATAEGITQGDGVTTGGGLRETSVGASIGDLEHGDRIAVNTPNSDGAYVSFQWTEDSGRYFTTPVYVADGTGPFRLRGRRVPKGQKHVVS